MKQSTRMLYCNLSIFEIILMPKICSKQNQSETQRKSRLNTLEYHCNIEEAQDSRRRASKRILNGFVGKVDKDSKIVFIQKYE
jgi:hypothetical protein